MAGENKHASRSAQTRQRFIEAAQKLYGERSIGSVSLNEITIAAGQKNRNALQYHFGNRSGLLQAIIDSHATQVAKLRTAYEIEALEKAWGPAKASAKVLVMPLADYINSNADGVYYIKLMSQCAAIDSELTNPETDSTLHFRQEPGLRRLLTKAMAHLRPAEAQRRMFLIVNMTFHGLAEACRASDAPHTARVLKNRGAMFEQVVCAVESLIAAAPRE